MSNPTVTCAYCDRRRDCMEHLRAEFPPDAAKKYLRRTCGSPDLCEFVYRAGVEPSGPVVGQSKGEG